MPLNLPPGVKPPLSKVDAAVLIETYTPMNREDAADILAAPPDAAAALVTLYAATGQMPRDSWAIFMSIVRVTVDVANIVIPIAGALAAFGVKL